ncbi:hypothetical protein AVEN_59531-1 [Araneus ventricosus]|uniref:C2H2-type domain-containing protein n=1 Tax=Araneus ventricosus TaxID=182803 RepID=A0A4Y2NWD7_ARAVE|nr:hypothetical protein AVEN_59531-1 [Araneus ventricosus]
MSRLLYDLPKHKQNKFYCDFCLHQFSTEEGLSNHQLDCRNHMIQKIRTPTEEEKWLQFNNHRFQLPVPYSIYADFECILEKLSSCEMNPVISSTQPITRHVACGFAYVVVGSKGRMVRSPIVYREEDSVDKFLKNLIEEEDWILRKIFEVKQMIFTDEDKNNFQAAVNCWVCEQPLNGDSVRDHNYRELRTIAEI